MSALSVSVILYSVMQGFRNGTGKGNKAGVDCVKSQGREEKELLMPLKGHRDCDHVGPAVSGGLGEGRRPACLKGANDTKTVQKNLIDCPTGLNSLCHRGPRQWRSTVQYCRNAKAVVPHKTCYVTHSAQGLHSFPHCLHSTRAALSSSEHALGVELPGLWLISHLRDATPIRASHSLSTPRPLFPPHQVQLT